MEGFVTERNFTLNRNRSGPSATHTYFPRLNLKVIYIFIYVYAQLCPVGIFILASWFEKFGQFDKPDALA